MYTEAILYDLSLSQLRLSSNLYTTQREAPLLFLIKLRRDTEGLVGEKKWAEICMKLKFSCVKRKIELLEMRDS